jgi:hypothetical protein
MARTPREIWAKRVERWQSSELTAKEFAAEIGVNEHTLAHWRWRLAKEETARPRRAARREGSSSAVTFTELPIEPSRSVPVSSIEIVVDSGLAIRVSTSFDEDTLRRVLSVVRVTA